MSRDHSLLQALYERHVDELVAYARQRVGGGESRDVVHDAYLRLAEYVDPATLDNPRAYLYRITGNVAFDYGTKHLRRAEMECTEAPPEDIASPWPGPERRAEARGTLQRCLAALERLPEVYRHVFLLHRIDGMTQGDIAIALDIPKRTVERYIARALACCLDSLRDPAGAHRRDPDRGHDGA
jgi:RNA polymerase sigma-70 factor (ECF subfamily)